MNKSWDLYLGSIGWWVYGLFVCSLCEVSEDQMREEGCKTGFVLLRFFLPSKGVWQNSAWAFSLCQIPYVFKKGNMCEMGQVTRELCVCLFPSLGRPIICSFRVLPDLAKINKTCSFHTTQSLNEKVSCLLWCSVEETIIYSSSIAKN